MENQQKHPTERILQAWSESKGNLQIGEENTKELEAVFTAVQKEMNFLSSRVSMVMNSIRLIKSQDTCQMRENKKENYTYIDATGAEVTATRQEVIEELKTLAQQAKTARYPVR